MTAPYWVGGEPRSGTDVVPVRSPFDGAEAGRTNPPVKGTSADPRARYAIEASSCSARTGGQPARSSARSAAS